MESSQVLHVDGEDTPLTRAEKRQLAQNATVQDAHNITKWHIGNYHQMLGQNVILPLIARLDAIEKALGIVVPPGDVVEPPVSAELPEMAVVDE